jgi:hypothetical protein
VHGDPQVMLGTITQCQQHLIHRELTFTVQYDQIDGAAAAPLTMDPFNGLLPQQLSETVSHRMAWGGHLQFCTHNRDTTDAEELPQGMLPMQWMVPSKRYLQENCTPGGLPSLIMVFRRCTLQFEAKQSLIEGAGTGLFVKCIKGPGLRLKPGQMLDIGVYTPFEKSEIKSEHISLLKNFLYDWKIGTWCVDTNRNDPKVHMFDLTEDFSGELSAMTKRNIVVYINEVVGTSETASISFSHDPDGKVHFLLGHWEAEEGDLSIRKNGEPMELLVRMLSCVRVYMFQARLGKNS